jgi:hypothetical protein
MAPAPDVGDCVTAVLVTGLVPADADEVVPASVEAGSATGSSLGFVMSLPTD